ncbi:MAG: twin-arginine translocase subunit TatC [Planctomycetota bacterium]|nr:twin-arginine translocase subunit TatC [Planctomycetota bacterium]
MAHNKRIPDPPNPTMSLGDHLEELRYRVILAVIGLAVALVASLFFGKTIISFLEKPYFMAMGNQARMQVLGPAEGFISYMNISLVTGVIIASPWIFYQLWMFVAAGLYPHEKRYVYMAVPFSAALFITGALFFIFVIAPITLKMLVLFNKEVLEVDSNFTFQKYISLITVMMLVFGLTFQTPIAVFFLNKIGLLSLEALYKSRRFVILGVIVAAAAATPGSDMFSLFALAIPMYLLFELGILLSYFFNRKKQNSTER